MINLFLKAKHWQLFLLTFGIPLILQAVIMGLIMVSFSTQTDPDPTIVFKYLKFFLVMMILFMGVFYAWFWSVAIGLQSKVPETINMKVGKFKIFFFISVAYLVFTMVGMVLLMNYFIATQMEPNIGYIIGVIALIIPLQLFAMFCIFYTMYFVAKTIKTVELQRPVQFSDFVGEFFMIWFYVIGIWILQPKINKMVEDKEEKYDSLIEKL